MTSYEYYQRELAKVKTEGMFAPNMRILNQNKSDYDNPQPKCLSLNHESAQAMADFLAERFGVYASHK